jgi:CIC family chloride channel protein
MNFDSPSPAQPAQSHGSLLVLAALALLVGAAAGAVGALFRIALEHADQWRNDLITRAPQEGLAGFLLVLVTSTTAPLFAAWLVRHVSPYASGSGIPHVEAVLREESRKRRFTSSG